MNLFEVLFPDEAKDLRRLARGIRVSVRASGRADREARKVEDQVEELEDDLGFLSLVTLTLFATLHEQGMLDKRDMLKRLSQIDLVDGVEDGQVSPEALRKAFGFAE